MAWELLRCLRMSLRVGRTVFGVYLAGSLALAIWMLPAGREQPPRRFEPPRPSPVWNPSPLPAADARAIALRQARVWQPADPTTADLAANPPDASGLLSGPLVRCRYVSAPARGTTPKFDCVLEDGEIVKVKYGHTSEIPAEVAASRLLAALGFGSDRMYVVPRVRCYGCVRKPFHTAWAFDYVRARDLLARSIPEDAYTDFEWSAVERHHAGLPIAAGDGDQSGGWAFYELEPIDPALGANRAERDALRLAAVLLAHWDNKAANQRLVCLDQTVPCRRPLAFIHDLGSTFGPRKLDIEAWRRAPVWADRARCEVSMQSLPFHGGTFPAARISEAGRLLLARQLAALREGQIAALFTAARVPQFDAGSPAGAGVGAWVRIFQDKVRQIAEAGPCH